MRILILLIALLSCDLSAAEKSYYEILGVSKRASAAAIKKAYRKQSMIYHPDRNHEPGAAETFNKIATAYEVLNDKEKREIYDNYGIEGLKRQEAGANEGSDIFDIFGWPFARQGGNRKGKAQASVFKLYLSLSQLYFGDLLQVHYTRPVICSKSEECIVTKKTCSGPGIRTVTQRAGPGFIVHNQMQDSSCIAREKAFKEKCSACPKGQTELEVIHTSVYVEPGMADDETITLEGSGVQSPGFESGDLIFKIKQIPHASYVRRGDDLESTVYLTLLESLVGFEREIDHISKIPLLLKRTGVTHEGELERFPGRGLPIRSGVNFGELRITYRIQYPVALDDEAKELIKKALSDVISWKYEILQNV